MRGTSPTIRLVRAAIVLSIVVAGLVVAERAAARRAAEVRPATAVLRELVPMRVSPAEIVAVDLVDAGGRPIQFRRDESGLWRCVSAHGVLADPTRINRLLVRTLGGGGIVRTSDPQHAGRYGLGGPAALRMVLSRRADAEQAEAADLLDDEQLEVVLDVEIGLSLRDADQTFVRLAGSDDVIALEADIRQELRPDGPGGLPMIETYLVPSGWPGLEYLPRQIVILRRGEVPTELRRIDEFDEAGELVRWRWLIRSGEGEFEPAHDALPVTFTAFLSRTRIVGIIGPEALPTTGLDAPAGRLLIATDFTEPMELRVAPAQEWGTPIYGSYARTISIVPNDVGAAMLPGPELFHPLMVENPWAAWTDRRGALPPGVPADAMMPPDAAAPTEMPE